MAGALRRRLSRTPRWALILLALAAVGIMATGYMWGQGQGADEVRRRGDGGRNRTLAAAREQLRAEPQVSDVVYDQTGDIWNIGVRGVAAPGKGFARYLCYTLIDTGALSSRTRVRVVDMQRLEANDYDYPGATVDMAVCAAAAPPEFQNEEGIHEGDDLAQPEMRHVAQDARDP